MRVAGLYLSANSCGFLFVILIENYLMHLLAFCFCCLGFPVSLRVNPFFLILIHESLMVQHLQTREWIFNGIFCFSFSLLQLSFAVGVDLSNSNVERLKRKFRLDANQDSVIFDLIKTANQKSLQLLSIQAVRKQLIESGHENIVVALKRSNFPQFFNRLLLLERW